MKHYCPSCKEKYTDTFLYCPRCAKPLVQTSIYASKRRSTDKFTPVGTFSACLSLIPLLAVVAFVTMMLVTVGENFGLFDFDDVAFDFFEALSGKQTPYEKTMGTIQYSSLAGIFLVCIPMAIILHIAGNKNKYNTEYSFLMYLLPGLQFAFLLSLFLLTFFDFSGIARTAMLITFYLSAVMLGVLLFPISKHFGGYTIVLQLMTFAIAFLLMAYIGPVCGWGLTIFGDLFWIFLLCLIMAGGGGSVFVYVVVI